MPTETISIESLNLQKQCGESVPMPVLDLEGNPIPGIELYVLGSHAPSVKEWLYKQLNQERQAIALKTRRKGKAGLDVTPIEDDIEFGNEAVAVRIVGWKGLTEPWSPEQALRLCTINPEILRQVREFTEELRNFSKA
jgi:hypothetical protein